MSEDKPSTNDISTASSEPVASPSQNPSDPAVFSLKKPQRSRKWLIAVVGLVILVVAGIGIWWWLGQRSPTTKQGEDAGNQPAFASVCDTATIQSAGRPISDNDIAGLQRVAEGVLQKKNYSGDVNCNYILMRYFLMIGDVPNAQKTLDDVVYTYGHYGGYSTTFDPPAISPAALKEALEVMIANNKEEQKQNDELDRLDP